MVKQFWKDAVERYSNQVFLKFNNDQYTYKEFDKLTNQLANGLLDLGCKQGDKVALLFRNSPTYLQCFLAISKIGAIVVPLINGLTPQEIKYVLNHSESSYLITDHSNYQNVNIIRDELNDLKKIVLTGNEIQSEHLFEQLLNNKAEEPIGIVVKPDDPMAIMYTSGSTGTPKGVVLPNSSFSSCGIAFSRRLNYQKTDTIFCTIPLFHAAGTHMSIAAAIACGAAVSLVEKFSASTFWATVDHHQVTKALLLPTMLSILMTLPPQENDRDHSLNLVISHIRPKEFMERFNVDICTTWNLTEIGAMGTLTSPNYNRFEPKLIGLPFPENAQVKIVDEYGNEVEPNKIGELLFKHPDVMKEYFKNHAATQTTLVNGWVKTGDLGRMDNEGRVYFEGRLKNVIKRSGENISGEEVEFTIMSHPAVEECVVFSVPDPIRTEEAATVIVISKQSKISHLDIIEWCKRELSDWKIPRYIELTHEPLPKLPNGKIDRVRMKFNSSNSMDRTKLNSLQK
ncbi:class I adenylate-forming enzyme family protein [Paenibacillus sp. BSR1-1]|uniref:class I adenylate-forming enzyme family protein n=1 Tax=Paenibacillus sp. BSR1-1 TaxID=3020845 RepID=UPI0025B16CC9|nr:class I adenylate-forming enzyme family protein [Paenibacillus sp. BSR1-1]MDN3016190.1 class I adenylate-forming enzyme family protein [Paenibacillus sp. BSR1-1]